MSKIKLTDDRIRKAKGPDKPSLVTRHWDTEVKCLFLEITYSGRKTFKYQYRYQNRSRCFVIGEWVRDGSLSPARKRATELAGQVLSGGDPQEDKAKEAEVPTLNQYLDGDYKNHLLSDRKSGDAMLKRLNCQFRKPFGRKRLNQFTVKDVESWKRNVLKEGRLSMHTINMLLTMLKTLFNHAVRMDVIKINPIANVQKFKPPSNVRDRVLSAEEDRLMMVLDDSLPSVMIQVLLNTGTRYNELATLQWQDINWTDNELTIRPEIAKNKCKRMITLNDTVKLLLKDWKKRTTSTVVSIRKLCSGNGDLIFANSKGKITGAIRHKFQLYCAKAKIEGLVVHDLRRTAATRMIKAGVDLATIRDIMCHKDFSILSRYLKSSSNERADAVSRLDR